MKAMVDIAAGSTAAAAVDAAIVTAAAVDAAVAAVLDDVDAHDNERRRIGRGWLPWHEIELESLHRSCPYPCFSHIRHTACHTGPQIVIL